MRQTVVLAASEHLLTLDAAIVRELVESIPAEWQVAAASRGALCDLIVERATFVAQSIEQHLTPVCWPDAGVGAPEE